MESVIKDVVFVDYATGSNEKGTWAKVTIANPATFARLELYASKDTPVNLNGLQARQGKMCHARIETVQVGNFVRTNILELNPA